MDQRTPFTDPVETQTSQTRTATKWLVWAAVMIGLIVAGAGFGYRMGRIEYALPRWVPAQVATALGARPEAKLTAPTGPITYYRDPDGKPLYSADPKKTQDGRDYLPVRASEDVRFDDKPPETSAGTPSAGSGKRLIYYRNPMGLPDTSPGPKKDSMGMDYIPVYEGEVEDGSIVRISPGKLQRTGVRSETVERRVVTRPVRAPGTVKLDERRVAVISLRSESFIDKVEDVTTGDRVRAGQPLLRLYSPEISAASAQYLSVLNEAATGPGRPALLEGARRRLVNLNVPAEVIAEIERNRKVPLSITWSAPRDGIILERNAVDGMRASTGDVLFRIADISLVWVLADVPEHDLGAIRMNQAATIRVRSLPGVTFKGKIGLIYPQVNAETRTTRVRVEIQNPDGVLLPDMYADVELATGSSAPVVAVPHSAVIDTGTRQVVIIDKGEGRFEPREVKVGARGEGFTQILEGIAEGDQVVVSANFLIDAESNLKAALQGMSAPVDENPQ